MRIAMVIVGIIILVAGTAFGFTDVGDSTITDSRTGLVWQKQDDGTKRIWEDAITYCEDLILAGHSDWRLPNIKELKTIVDNLKYDPAINIIYFPNTQSNLYWSSTYARVPMGVNFVDGIVFTNNNSVSNYSSYVRCVRGGQ